MGGSLSGEHCPPFHGGPQWPRNPHLTTATAKTAGNLNISTPILLKTPVLCLFPCRSSHLPLFVQMSPRRSDWSHAGLKGVIPSALHYSLLGYNFFIPDAVGEDFFPSLLPVAVFSVFFVCFVLFCLFCLFCFILFCFVFQHFFRQEEHRL